MAPSAGTGKVPGGSFLSRLCCSAEACCTLCSAVIAASRLPGLAGTRTCGVHIERLTEVEKRSMAKTLGTAAQLAPSGLDFDKKLRKQDGCYRGNAFFETAPAGPMLNMRAPQRSEPARACPTPKAAGANQRTKRENRHYGPGLPEDFCVCAAAAMSRLRPPASPERARCMHAWAGWPSMGHPVSPTPQG
eukprot:scaffold99172_cov63-Phaeocystis_antarctica.AAC.2